jgi:hypothetical protein
MPTSPLSQSLLNLSDAIEQLAYTLAQSKTPVGDAQVKDLAVLIEKFKKSIPQADVSNKETVEQQIHKKHQKGWLMNWLQQKNIYVGKHTDHLRVNAQLYAIADYLTDHYAELKDFYAQLKRSQNIKQDFKIRTTSQSVKYIHRWCDMLHQSKIIDGFQIDPQQQVDVDLARIHEATYFINGYWLEILLSMEIGTYIKQNIEHIQSFDFIAQVELVNPNRTNTEIDLLLMLNEQVYWFECKSGNIGEYYRRFAQTRKRLQLDAQHAFIVVPMMQMHQANAAHSFSGMTLLYATHLDIALRQYIALQQPNT